LAKLSAVAIRVSNILVVVGENWRKKALRGLRQISSPNKAQSIDVRE
jgi:hypothetical protein